MGLVRRGYRDCSVSTELLLLNQTWINSYTLSNTRLITNGKQGQVTQLFSCCYLRNYTQVTACRQLSSRRLLSFLLKEGAAQTVFDYLLIEASGTLWVWPFTWPLLLLVASCLQHRWLFDAAENGLSLSLHGRDNISFPFLNVPFLLFRCKDISSHSGLFYATSPLLISQFILSHDVNKTYSPLRTSKP